MGWTLAACLFAILLSKTGKEVTHWVCNLAFTVGFHVIVGCPALIIKESDSEEEENWYVQNMRQSHLSCYWCALTSC